MKYVRVVSNNTPNWGATRLQFQFGVLLGPSFGETEDTIESQDENNTQEEKGGTKPVVSPNLVLTGVSPPVLPAAHILH